MNQKALIYIFTSLLVLMMSWEAQRSMSVAAANLVAIPDEAIRLRILANSDSPKDQWLKREIRDQVNMEITEWVTELESIDDARGVIRTQLDRIEEIVQLELTRIGITDSFTVEFDEVQFPTKLYGNTLYPAGLYEAILITIGEGKGENWWCVLFPPLCFIDFANGDAVEGDGAKEQSSENEDEVEVRFFVFDLFTKVKNIFV
ncbi:stage II sporulation protein R [Anaerobacillus alkalidiazotrophicus]|uniref:Stage II sporulation protein R n=1 Tax=Anaerobacillus alkalidiazotrophicus TaxID=472963 RepID=A0A1S2MDN9_9BACI|nr:stage II sporulation protein R [Anaerobacillus alkalidiazotrophicus]OIJ21805.1 stage II sporulation protein R [Anaerobacillus alkalidiazotrophicus]